MTVRAHAPGFEFTPDDAFVPSAYSAHAAMVTHAEGVPATPTVLIELEGFSQSDLPLPEGQDSMPTRSLRILLEEHAALAIAQAIGQASGLLQRLRRNQGL